MTKLTLNYPNIQDERGQLHSIADPSLYLTFGVWLYLVPQYKPESVLMLGYGGGTAAKYIRMFHGNVPITAVDHADVSEFLLDNMEWVEEDAQNYVKTAPKFDCVIVDCYDTGDFMPPEFVLSKEFADDLGQIANYVILHTVVGNDISAYDQYKKIRTLNLGRTDKYAPEVHYFMINEIASLPVR